MHNNAWATRPSGKEVLCISYFLMALCTCWPSISPSLVCWLHLCYWRQTLCAKIAILHLLCPPVILIFLCASSLCVSLLETQPATEVLRTGQVGGEILEHQRNLVILAASTFVVAALLFATALLVWRALAVRMQPKAMSVTSVVFGLVYVLCSVLLIIAA